MMAAMVGETRERESERRLEMVRRLEKENLDLRKDNEMLLNTVAQMQKTMSRLINRYGMEKGMR